MLSNDIKCKYMFMFLLKNLARKGLIEKYVSIGTGNNDPDPIHHMAQ